MGVKRIISEGGVGTANHLLDPRDFVIPDDIRLVASDILRHRLTLTADYQIDGYRIEQVIDGLINTVPAPRQ